MSEYVRIWVQYVCEYVWGRIRCLYSTCISTYSDSWCVFSVFVVYSDDECEATCILMYLDVFRHVFRNPREYALEYRRIRAGDAGAGGGGGSRRAATSGMTSSTTSGGAKMWMSSAYAQTKPRVPTAEAMAQRTGCRPRAKS